MRLIDADEFKERIVVATIKGNYSPHRACELCVLIDEQPTAYEPEEVARRIEKKALKMSTAKPPHTYMRAIGTHEAVKIVRNGG